MPFPTRLQLMLLKAYFWQRQQSPAFRVLRDLLAKPVVDTRAQSRSLVKVMQEITSQKVNKTREVMLYLRTGNQGTLHLNQHSL